MQQAHIHSYISTVSLARSTSLGCDTATHDIAMLPPTAPAPYWREAHAFGMLFRNTPCWPYIRTNSPSNDGRWTP